ncbi:MAG: hypothetical protein ACYCXQ_00935 [Candidatus Humimicrobiaceae bacterium]
MSEKIEFIASLPAIQSAIQISGDGNGARIKLEIPQSEMLAISKLPFLYGKYFKVIISIGDE